jgi:hypothetical protein
MEHHESVDIRRQAMCALLGVLTTSGRHRILS